MCKVAFEHILFVKKPERINDTLVHVIIYFSASTNTQAAAVGYLVTPVERSDTSVKSDVLYITALTDSCPIKLLGRNYNLSFEISPPGAPIWDVAVLLVS